MMTDETEHRLWQLRVKIEAALDRLHDELLVKLRFIARSDGQRMRVDRVMAK